MNPLLRVENIKKTFTIHHLDKKLEAIQNVSFTLNKGDFLGVVGRSGSGKSTVLKLIYRSYLPEGGRILYDSERFGLVDLNKISERQMIYLRKYEIGYVSQFLNAMPRTNARELVEQSLLEMGEEELNAQQLAEETLHHFGLAPSLWDAYPVTFSGGEKLRLNIARAVVKKPRLLLLDEPTASFDKKSKLKVKDAIMKLKERGTTLIGIFHDIEFMEGICDEVLQFEQFKAGVKK